MGLTHARILVLLGLVLGGCSENTQFNDKTTRSPTTSSGEGTQSGLQNPPPPVVGPSTTVEGKTAADVEKTASSDGSLDQTAAAAPKAGALTEEKLKTLCANAANVKSLKQAIKFPKPAQSCQWNTGGNLPLPTENLIFSARNEQKEAVTLPDGALLCDMRFNFPASTTMLYDDEIILSFNNIVMMSSQDFVRPGELEKKDGLVGYDWDKIKGKPYQKDQRPVFFVDAACGADCALPPTETVGAAKLKVLPDTVRKISLATGVQFSPDAGGAAQPSTARTKQEFSFITIGDNDPGLDCLHQEFGFEVEIKYVTAK